VRDQVAPHQARAQLLWLFLAVKARDLVSQERSQ
jgi:hypothetical protein